ncbi:MAG: hypothetical protein AAFN77_10915 [Planctomycetota bacterium]
MTDPIHDRGKQMEDLFFKQQDEALLQRMRDERGSKEKQEQLSHACGITDSAVIDKLVEVGVTADSLTSVSMIPLVAVAWADKMMEATEQTAILDAAHSVGIEKGSASHELLAGWLKTQPSGELLDAWKGYIKAISEKIDATAMSQLKNSVLGRAEDVAKAAGGFLGFGNKVSEVEQTVIDDLKSAF